MTWNTGKGVRALGVPHSHLALYAEKRRPVLNALLGGSIMKAYRSVSGRAVIGSVLALGSLVLLTGSGALSDEKTKTVKMRDDCEPASFNAAVGPGTCVGDGKTTFAQFIQELREEQTAEDWRFNPSNFDVAEGKMLLLKTWAARPTPLRRSRPSVAG
jgi:hypothetical protein